MTPSIEKQITFNESEAKAAIELFHIAIKAMGLEGPHSENAVVLTKKIKMAFVEQPKEELTEN